MRSAAVAIVASHTVGNRSPPLSRMYLGPRGKYYQAKARYLDTENKTIQCESIHDKEKFHIDYDKLIISVGVKTNTFGIESIQVS